MATPVPVSTDDMVGRRQELEVLRSSLDAACEGAGRLVLCAGEPGIGKTRLAQELAGLALARGVAVAWGRSVEVEGAPAFWPWRQVLRTLGVDPEIILAGDVESPADRFRVFDDMASAVLDAAGTSGLVVILDDVHWADEPSLLVLRHLADQVGGTRLLVLATFRHVAAADPLPRLLPDLLRAPGAEKLELRGFSLVEVRELLSGLTVGGAAPDPRAVLDVTAGNPLFVREISGAIADGTWRPDRPPRTVLDVVNARLDRISTDCRRMVEVAAIVGRDFPVGLVAAALDEPVLDCLPLIDEAIAHDLVGPVGDVGEHRFVHALTRDAVESSLTTAHRVALHRTVAEAMEVWFAGNLSDHLADIARHWAEVSPYGEAATARRWAIRAADDATRLLSYEEAVRLYGAALELDAATISDVERCRLIVALGRAAYLAGDLQGCVEAAIAAADAARTARSPELVGEAALVLEAAPDPRVNAVAKQLCEEALCGLSDPGHDVLRARLLAQRSHLAFYDGEQDRVGSLSASALDLARTSGDYRALLDALHARKEACPGPARRPERVALATEMLALARRTVSARAAMWGALWRIEALIESGQLASATEGLAALQLAVERVGGPVSAWHLDRVSAGIAQATGRYADAASLGRRAFERMRPIEPSPATGAYFSLQCALAGHIGVTDEAATFATRPFESPPRFRTMARISRAFLLLRAGLPDEAAVSYQQAGPMETWTLPVFFTVPGHVFAALVSAELGRYDDLAALLDRLRPLRGEHASGEGVSYLGPVDLTLGRSAAVLGQLDAAVEDLAAAVVQAGRAGAPGFVAEASHHLAVALLARSQPGDRKRAELAAHDADRLARALGMAAYVDRTGALVAQLAGGEDRRDALSPRETEVADLVAEGLTNRQIADRLFISERTAQNHVQHVLTKLGFTSRSQIAAWAVRAR